MSSSKALAAVASVAAVAMALLTSCATDSTAQRTPPPPRLGLAGDYSGTGPGSLKTADTLLTVDRRLIKVSSIAARITYDSTSGSDGGSHLVSGSVFAPVGIPPEGGWPIIAMGHGSTGVQPECGPSLSESLRGSADAVATLLASGYVVAVPDYQGLGLDDAYHPYLNARTSGYNMIDAVRAARKLVPNTSDRWLAYGSSQGGQASWAANDLAGSYGGGLELVGSVSIAPATQIAGLADLAADGNLTPDQAAIMPWILWALKKEHPELNLDDYRRGIVTEHWDVFTACEGPAVAQRTELLKQITPDDLRPANGEATDLLRRYLQDMSVPLGRSTAPMLVLFGSDDRVVAADWTTDAITRACTMGAVEESYVAEGKGHDDIDPLVALAWMKNRFKGVNPLDMCDAPSGPVSTMSDRPWYANPGE